MDFKDRVVIVTGAGKGIGIAIARMYALNGAKVGIAERDPKLGRTAEQSIVFEGASAIFILADVSDPEAIEKLVKKASDLFGRIDILINNAGISEFKSPYDLPVEEWDEIINTNLRGLQ